MTPLTVQVRGYAQKITVIFGMKRTTIEMYVTLRAHQMNIITNIGTKLRPAPLWTAAMQCENASSA